MPAGDRTGPMGMGSMTGRGAGYCGGFAAPGFANAGPGRGRGFGRRFSGGGFGWRNRFFATGLPARTQGASYAPADPEAEKQGLKQQVDALQSELEMIRKRLDELTGSAS